MDNRTVRAHMQHNYLFSQVSHNREQTVSDINRPPPIYIEDYD